MTIKAIFAHYPVPLMLQKHMLLTAHMASLISQSWKGESFNMHDLLIACLLHDLANLIKSDLEKFPQFLGEEEKDISVWKERKAEMIAQYGSDEHEATKIMLTNLNVSNEIITLILAKTFSQATEIENSTNWPLKILLYCDMRVSPTGIVPLEERVRELMNRSTKYAERTDLLQSMIHIEQQLQEHMERDITALTDIGMDDTMLMSLET